MSKKNICSRNKDNKGKVSGVLQLFKVIELGQCDHGNIVHFC